MFLMISTKLERKLDRIGVYFTFLPLNYLRNPPDSVAYFTSGKECFQTLNGKVPLVRER